MPHNFLVEHVLRITELNNCLRLHYPHPYEFKGEFHPFWEMVYTVKGTFQVAGNEKVYEMKQGDVIFHQPMEFHRLWSVEEQDVHAYIFGFCAEGSLQDQLGGAFVLKPQQRFQLEALMEAVVNDFPGEERDGLWDHLQTMIMKKQENAVQLQTFVERFQLFLMSLTEQTEPLVAKQACDNRESLLYRQTVRLLTEHIDSWIDAPTIARRIGCSVSALKRAFAKFSDVGIHKYLLKLKIAEGIRLLSSGRTCSEVSRLLDFANQNYFSTVFKRETGFPPSHYLGG